MNLLVTGATGSLGFKVVAKALRSSRVNRIVLPVRGDDIHGRWSDMMVSNASHAPLHESHKDKIELVSYEELLESKSIKVDSICHSAADVRWHLPFDDIKTSNVDVSKNLFQWMKETQSPRCNFVYVSTIFAKPKGMGVFLEQVYPFSGDSNDYPNTYLASKAMAEHELSRLDSGCDQLTIVRAPGILPSSGEDGWTMGYSMKPVAYNGLMSLMDRLFKELPYFMGKLDANANLETVDSIAGFALSVCQGESEQGGVYNPGQLDVSYMDVFERYFKRRNMTNVKSFSNPEEAIALYDEYMNKHDETPLRKPILGAKIMSTLCALDWPTEQSRYQLANKGGKFTSKLDEKYFDAMCDFHDQNFVSRKN